MTTLDNASYIWWRLSRRFRGRIWNRLRDGLWEVIRPTQVACESTGHVMFLNRSDERAKSLWASSANVNAISTRLWQRLVRSRPWTVVLDIGSNHGEMILNVPLPRGARVFAFEPNPALAALLRKSVAKNRLSVTVIEAAVGDRESDVTLHINPNWSGISSLIPDMAGTGSEQLTVRQLTLSNFLAEQEIKVAGGSLLLKIDVEGYELQVLRGLLSTVSDWSHLAIMMEIKHLDLDTRSEIGQYFDFAVPTRLGRLAQVSASEPIWAHDDAVLVRRGDTRSLITTI